MDKKYFSEDLIVASATGIHTRSAIALLRVSGRDCFLKAKNFLRLVNLSRNRELSSGDLSKIQSHHMYRCHFIVDGDSIIDDGMVVFFKGPHSYTGEDMLELHLHGNPVIQKAMLDHIVATSGARPAERGEFSFRAFRNGKLDLSQVEAVESLIAAETVKGAEVAAAGLSGTVRKFIDPIQGRLKDLLASLELELDFSDQEVQVLDWLAFNSRLDSVIRDLSAAVARFDALIPLVNGVRVSFVGKPNSGKSTLFNLLLGEDRSIVSDVQGTTRDVVRESTYLDNILLKFSDTAGLRDSSDAIESEGIKRSKKEILESELVLIVADVTEFQSQERRSELEQFLGKLNLKLRSEQKRILVLNKLDLLDGAARIEDGFSSLGVGVPIFISCKDGSGLDNLRARIQEEFSAGEIEQSRADLFCSRQRVEVIQALELLTSVRDRAGEDCEALDLLALDLRSAMTHLAELSGNVDSEMVLNHIFSSFCIGK